jgi:hypothetical protein
MPSYIIIYGIIRKKMMEKFKNGFFFFFLWDGSFMEFFESGGKKDDVRIRLLPLLQL